MLLCLLKCLTINQYGLDGGQHELLKALGGTKGPWWSSVGELGEGEYRIIGGE
jgi:hypothetical protein